MIISVCSARSVPSVKLKICKVWCHLVLFRESSRWVSWSALLDMCFQATFGRCLCRFCCRVFRDTFHGRSNVKASTQSEGICQSSHIVATTTIYFTGGEKDCFWCWKIGEQLFGVGKAPCLALLVESTWKVCGFTACSSVMEVPVSTAQFQKQNLLSQVFVQSSSIQADQGFNTMLLPIVNGIEWYYINISVIACRWGQ